MPDASATGPAGAASEDALVGALDDILPQAQCARCGYPGCRPYALALAQGRASLDLCPPGGEDVRRALAARLGRSAELGADVHPPPRRLLATVVEADCIGCTRCIQACPVDAIVGAAGCVHDVVQAWCSGCELCLPVCPTDCIDMIPATADAQAFDRDAARERFRQREQRRRDGTLVSDDDLLVSVDAADPAALQAEIRAAVARRREAGSAPPPGSNDGER